MHHYQKVSKGSLKVFIFDFIVVSQWRLKYWYVSVFKTDSLKDLKKVDAIVLNF